MDLSKQLRLAALIFFIFLALIHSSYSRYHGKRHKRQNGAHMYLPESFIVPNGEGEPDEWSEWSSPSECSRSCGGGVSFQTRECLRYASSGARQCSGGSRKYFSCNTQDCPEEEPDFRAQQCSRFDSIPFDGVRYEWVPYTNAPNPCELNCMPRGERFYYRHKAKVADGTRCNDKTLDVCVNGECQPVGCDMMLGSNAREDKCRKCAGDGSSCKTISGLFDTNNLAAGYNDILLIPTGATNIVLKEVAPSNNYLACRNLTGHYYLNGNWRIDFPRPMHFAGSWWHYQRKPTGFAAPDQLTCSGPTTESIYVVMLIQDRNVGVQYEYSIPETVTRSFPDTYSWTHMEYGPCSVSCGGGVQSRNVTCNNRLTLEKVDESLCDANTKPSEAQACGTEECAPHWVEGIWGKCSKSCGNDGVQNRTVSCERISPNGVASVVEDSVCLKAVGNKPADTQECNRDVVNCPKFHTGPWTPCNKLCGEGKRSRKVTCFKEENGRKKVLPVDECSEEKPDSEETCILAPCEGVDWIISQWSGCEKCGQTKETRTAICGSKSGKLYDEKFCSPEKPELVRPCKSTKCQTQWFTSQWNECSAKCGKGIQSRIVICGEFDGATVKPASDDSKCNAAEKPSSEQECDGEVSECPGEWFTGPWGKCSKTCGGGQRTREVLCLANGTKVSTCEESKIEFGSENCNNQACTDDETIPVDTTSRSVEDDEDSGEECDEDYDELDTGIEFVPEKRKEDLKLGEGVELDTATTTLSSLIMDDLMLSDSPSTDDKDISTELTTELPETTVEGSGEDSDVTISSTINVSEGSGDDDEEGLTTKDLVTESTESGSTQDITDITQSSDSSTDVSEQSSTDVSGTSESSSEAASTSVTDKSESPSSISEDESTLTSEDLTGTESTDAASSTKDSTETSVDDTSDVSTGVSDTSTASTDISSSPDGSSTLVTESSTEQGSSVSSTDDSSTVTGDSTISDATSDSSTETTLNGSTETTLDSSTETTLDSSTETTLDSSTETTSDSSTETTPESSTDITSDSSTETTSESSTETTLESSTETTSESSTETTSESNTETTSESSTETTSESSTETTSESSTETTSESSTDTTSDVSTETTLDGSTETTLDGSTETTLDSSTETTLDSSTETTLDSSTETTLDSSTETTSESSTELTSERSTDSTLDVSTETSTDAVSSSTDISTEDTAITEDSSSDSSSIGTSSDLTTVATSDSSEDTTTESSSTEDHSDSSTESSTDLTTDAASSETSEGSSSSTESGLTDTTGATTDETITSSTSLESSTDVTTPQFTTDVTTEISTTASDVSTTTDLSTSDDSSTIYDSTTSDYEETSSTDISTTEVIDGSQSSSSVEATTVDIWSSESTEITDEDMEKTTPNTLGAALDRESKPRKCKAKKPKKEKCVTSEFGCCPDKKTNAKGPFGLGCPVIKTCADSEFGCCLDGLSPAEGKNNEGCPKSLCAETLFGCCPDNFTPADGEDNEGCPEPTTEPPTTTVTEEETEETTLSSAMTDVTESSTEVTEESDFTDSTESTDTTEIPLEVKTVKSCSFDKFGCCPDGKTPAEGENFKGCDIVDEKDCSKSVYGCCRDRKSSARGPNEEGCAPCTQEPYGCCPDGVNPAHGALGEGCCLNTQFGCCPDNINAARGPNFEDCDCRYTPYGCCADNTTAARGYDNMGCGCETSPFGCCPDKITPAAGEKFDGCPCHTMQFGCCPDGVTVPQGPHHYGCHCSQTQYKCCSDEKTPAKGPNFEGCTCAESKFGCCPDGATEAQGDKFEGCEIVQESPQKACGLPKETGNCSNFTIKYFFDTSYGACARFWYGGCDGNGNRFETEAECRGTCQEYKGKDTCLLPKSAGPCPGFQKKWYYNSERSRCEEFNYGGCYGTSNRFDSLDECKAQCSVEESLPPCEQPVDQGPCQGNFQRWHYDNETDVCRPFTYGGCKGNKNNYATEHACEYHCRQPGVHKELCALPKESGNCGGNHARWHFSESDQKCLPFYYTGCGGNKNNFQTLESCEEHCPKKIAKDVCEIPAEVGECQNYTPRWYWDTKDSRCRQFYYGGCGGNENNFVQEEECSERCQRKPEEPTTTTTTTTPRQPAQRPVDQLPTTVAADSKRVPPPENTAVHGDDEKCFQPAVAGDCDEYMARWFYNADEGICDQFIYRGCRGNSNNFESEEECENNCFHVHSTCSLPPVYGRCNDNTTRWHYDERSKSCYGFEFSGCRGNRNNFFTEQECMDYCQNTHPEEEAPHTEGYSHTADDQCDLPLATGDCRDNVFSWFYNKDAKQCEGFYYTGCNGNANRFESREQCDRQCGQFKDVDVCNDPLVVGSCRQWETRFYFDKESQTCEPFTYGGCGGSGNRFVNKAECQSVCIVGKEPTDNRAICLLPPNVGNCTKATMPERRWYYDDDRGTCVPFVYSGCSGNQNNFRSLNSCNSFCANQTENEVEIEPRFDDPKPSADRCESYEEQCRSLQCPFGAKSERSPDGCRRCECIDPCANYSCPNGEKCAVDVSSDPSLEARFIPICRQVNKPGNCPQLSNSSGCHRECYDDADCRDDNKCCSEGCSHVCVRPHQPQIQTTTLSPPAPRTEVIFPGESPAALQPKRPEEVEVTSTAGSVAVLRCFATGNPPPIVTWRRGAVLVDTNKGRYVLTSSGDLTIVQVHQSDSGSYICVASNGLGAPVSREVNLQVSDTETNIPAYIYGPKNVTQIVTIKQPAVIRCPAGGHPKPHVNWWRGKNRMPLTTSRYDTKRDYSLVFRAIELSDLGPYECSAWTGHGKPASMVVVLKAVGPVHVTNRNDEPFLKYILNPVVAPTTSKPAYPFHPSRPQVRPPPPQVVDLDSRFGGEKETPTSPPYRKSVRATALIRRDSSNNYTVGSDVVLNCDVGGYPAPNVTWSKDSKQVLSSNRVQITENPYRLVIYGVTAEDSGYYGCTARNTFSFNTSEEKILIESGVYVRPDCTDNKYFANCALIVKGRYCSNEYYGKFCCRSCTLAGQLPGGHPNSL